MKTFIHRLSILLEFFEIFFNLKMFFLSRETYVRLIVLISVIDTRSFFLHVWLCISTTIWLSSLTYLCMIKWYCQLRKKLLQLEQNKILLYLSLQTLQSNYYTYKKNFPIKIREIAQIFCCETFFVEKIYSEIRRSQHNSLHSRLKEYVLHSWCIAAVMKTQRDILAYMQLNAFERIRLRASATIQE